MVAHVGNIRASVGARLNSLESMAITADDRDYQFRTRLTELQDLDYVDATSRMQQINLQLTAAQLTFKQTSQLSLFNIL
jgi:flagellar hook-associated protein 3 FlgL